MTMKRPSLRPSQYLRLAGALALYSFGVAIIIASNGGGSGVEGSGGEDSGENPPVGPIIASIKVQPGDVVIEAGDEVVLTATALDESGNEIEGKSASWEMETGLLATVSDGVLKAKYAGSDQVVVTIDDKTERVPVEIEPRNPEPISLPLAWPLDRAKDSISLVSQDFDEINDASVKHHTGTDIRAEAGTPIFAAGSGWLKLVQLYNGSDKKMGNTVIVAHEISGYGRKYTQYSHLQHISIADLDRANYVRPELSTVTANLDKSLREVLNDVCDETDNSGTWLCPDGSIPIIVDSDSIVRIGFSGKSGDNRYDPHLHFEVKDEPFLGSSTNTEFGYTAERPQLEGFYDPVAYFQFVTELTEPFQRYQPTTVGTADTAASLRMGPGGHASGRLSGGGYLVNSEYRAVNELKDGDIYYLTGTAANPVGVGLECNKGWYRLRRVTDDPDITAKDHDKKKFYDKKEPQEGDEGKGQIGDAWACFGHKDEDNDFTYLEPVPDNTPPDPPTELSATAVSSSRIELTWRESNDAEEVAGYVVYRNSTLIRSGLRSTTYSDSEIESSTLYCYFVTAVNFAGLESEQSNEVCETAKEEARYDISIAPIITLETGIPNSDRQFSYIRGASIDGDNIAFVGGDHSTRKGVYQADKAGNVIAIADKNTNRPDRPSAKFTPTGFFEVDTDGGAIVFQHNAGLYKAENGGSQLVLSTNDRAPGDSDRSYGAAKELKAQGGDIAFTSSTGVFYLKGSVPELVANLETDPPGESESFLRGHLRYVALHNGEVAFAGYGTAIWSVYSWPPSELELEATGEKRFGHIALDDSRIVYSKEDAKNRGELIVLEENVGTPIFVGEKSQHRVSDVFADGGRVAYSQIERGQKTTIEMWVKETSESDGVVITVFDARELLDGRVVWDFDLAGLSGNTLIFIARWDPRSDSLYRAEIVKLAEPVRIQQ
jgi:murein DD-endopeptidase MepM/ murein hydrolase activator NlpD